MSNKKYYELLEVDSKATQDEIRRSYRKKATKMHPDKGGDQGKVTTEFININSSKSFSKHMRYYQINQRETYMINTVRRA